ncbi:hypothetical protein NE398_20545, partial [Clostridium tertium]
MATQKKATYKVDNGTDFDEIYFKTILEQVKFADGTSLKDFFDKGGTIGGPIGTNRVERVIPVNTIEDGYAVALALKSANGLDKLELLLGKDSGKKALYPIQRYGLGTPNFAFSELWAGDFLKGG